MAFGEESAVTDIKGKGVVTAADHDDEAIASSSTAVQTEEIIKSPTADHDDDDDENKFSVLIVDDSAFIRLLHRLLMKSLLGLDAQVAENGLVAVDLHRFGASFDLILIDMDMPVMNGIQATMELRAMGVKSLIVGVTACFEGPERYAFVEAGLNDCFSKPLDEVKFAALLQMLKEAKAKSDDN